MQLEVSPFGLQQWAKPGPYGKKYQSDNQTCWKQTDYAMAKKQKDQKTKQYTKHIIENYILYLATKTPPKMGGSQCLRRESRSSKCHAHVIINQLISLNTEDPICGKSDKIHVVSTIGTY